MGLVESCQPTPDGIQEPVGRRVEQEPKLVGPEGMAAQAIGEAALLEIFDTQLRPITPPGVPVIHLLGWIIPGGDDKSEVAPFLQRLRFVDDPSLMCPGVGRILSLREEPYLLSG